MNATIFICAAAFSTVGTIAGFGGGMFLVPLMVVGFNIPITIAVGVTAMSLFPSSLLSTILNHRKNEVDYSMLVAMELPTIIGAFLGAHLTSVIPTGPLEFIFAAFLLFIAWKTYRPTQRETFITRLVKALNAKRPIVVDKEYKVSAWASTFFGLMAGMIAGLFGIGGGILKTPIMLNVFKIPVRTATSTAIAMIAFTSLTSGITHYSLGHVPFALLIPAAGGFLLGAVLGNLIGVKLKDQAIKRLIAISISLASLAILSHAI